jgi:hypothetical protein
MAAKRRDARRSTAAETTIFDRVRINAQDVETERYFLGAWMRQSHQTAIFEAIELDSAAFSN